MPPESPPASSEPADIPLHVVRDDDGFPVLIPDRTWVLDAELGTEVFRVNEIIYLSYRGAGVKPRDPAYARHCEFYDRLCGLPPWREETAIVRRGRPTLVLLGNHKAELVVAASGGEGALRRYYDGSSRHCPRAPRRWNSEDPN